MLEQGGSLLTQSKRLSRFSKTIRCFNAGAGVFNAEGKE